MPNENEPVAAGGSPMQQWASIAQSERFKQLPAEHRSAVRDRFYERSIQPAAPVEALKTIRERFMERTAADIAPTANGAGNEGKGFVAGLQSGWGSLKASGGGMAMLVGDAIGSEDLSNAGLAIYERNSRAAQESGLDYGFTDLFDGDRDDTSALQWATHTAGQLVPSIGSTIVGGGVGGAVAKQAATRMAKKKALDAAEQKARAVTAQQVGQAAGAGAASFGQNAGSLMGQTQDAGVSVAHGAAMAALDSIVPVQVLRKVGGAGMPDKAAKEIAERALADLQRTAGRSVPGAAVRGGLSGGAGEAGTEAMQALIEQHAIHWVESDGASLLGDIGAVDWKEVLDNAAAGGLGGGMMGAPAGVAERSHARQAVARHEQSQELRPADADATFESIPDTAALPAPGLQGLPAPERTFYADSQGNVQDTGPVRNVDGEMQPDPQGRQWVNPENDPARMAGGPGMDRQTARGAQAPLVGDFQYGSRQAVAETAAPRGQTLEGEIQQTALPEPDAIVVDREGNARRGATAPQVFERPASGGRGMDQQAPTARIDDQDYDVRLRKSGKPFVARGDARLSRLFSDAKKAGESPKVIRHGDGWAVGVPKAPQRLEMRPIDTAAQQAATSPSNDLPTPTPAQIEAGNYRKGHVRLAGLDISIENPRGSERSGTDPDGNQWRHTMSDHYGYIRRTQAADGEQMDVYVGPQPDSAQVFVVDQLNQQDGSFDEHKIMLGYPDEESATAAYRSNFDADWKMGNVTAMPVAEFKGWLKDGDLSVPVAPISLPQSAERRRSAAPVQGSPASRRPRRAVNRDRDSVVQAAIRLGGITKQWKQDTTGDTVGNKNIPGIGALWSDNTGTSLDDMASLLDQHGYVPYGEMERDGGVSWLQEALRDELAGRKTHLAPGSKRQEEEAQKTIAQRAADIAAQQEADGGFDSAEVIVSDLLDDVDMMDIRAENARRFAEELDAIFEGGSNEISTGTAATDNRTEENARPENGASGSDGAGESGAVQRPDSRTEGAPSGEGFELAQQTERGLKEQAAQQRAAEQAEGQAQRQAEQKAQADKDRADFTLTGSDRPADVGAARGQNDLFGAKPVPDQLYRRGQGRGADASEVARAIAGVPELAGLQVVQSFDELPLTAKIRAERDGVMPDDVRGIFRADGQHLVADNHQDLEDAVRSAVHEMVGHLGVRGVLGSELDETMERIYSSEMMRAKGQRRIAQIREFYAGPLKGKSARQQRLLIAQEIVAHLAESGDRPTLLQRVASKIREMLRKAFPQVPWTYTDVLVLIERSRQWLRAQRGEVAGDDQLYSQTPASSEAAAFREQLVRAMRVGGGIDKMLTVGRTPSVYRALGAADLPVSISKDTVLKASNGVKHHVPLEVIEQLPELLTDPVMVFSSATQQGSLVSLIEAVDADGKPVVVAMQLSSQNRRVIVNRIASVYGKDGVDGFVKREVSNGRLLYRHTAKSREWLQSRGLQLPKEGATHGSGSRVLTDADIVNRETQADAEGNRIAAARDEGLFRVDEGAAGDRSGTEAPVDPIDDTLYSLRSTRRSHASDAFPDLNADEQAALRKIAPQTPRERAIDWYRTRTDRLMTKIRQGLVDRYAALKELDEQAHGTDFLDTSITSSAWVLARMAPAAASALNAMLHNGRLRFDAQQKVIGMRDDGSMGLGEVLGRLGDAKEIERFMGWIAGNRAAKLAAEGRENLFDAQDIAALQGINRGTTADGRTRAALYDEVFREFQQYRDDVLAIAEQTGIISPENRAMWRDEFYVPFYRVADEEAKAKGPKAGKGLSRQEAYKKLKGGKQNLNDLLENTLMNFHHLLTASLKNQAAAQAITNAERLAIAREVPEAARDPKNSTFVLKGGERVWYEIDDPMVFEALSSLADPGLNNLAVRTMAGFKRVLTNMTTITPQFIVANFLRDSMQAAATTPVSKNVPANMFQGIAAFRDQKIRAQMLASGGAFSFGHIYGADPEEVKAGLQRGLRGAKLVDGPKLVPKLLVAGWDAYNAFANTAENANRAAAYQQNTDKGTLRAAYEARDLMDFSQEGGWPAVRFLIRVVPFLNARLQGLDKLYRSGAKPAVLTAFGKGTTSDRVAAARFATVTGALALASLALYLANYDDEEYRKLEDWQKDSYWFFRIGDQAFFLPKPFEVGAISTLAERLAEQAIDDKATGKLFRDRLWAMVTQTFAFSPVPQAFQPALDVYSNKDAFTGRPIESPGMERVSPELRARSTTSAPARAISSATSALGEDFTLSPLQADHLIRGYLGQVGAWGAGVIDTIWRTANGESEPAKRWHEYQPIRRFYRDLGAPAPYDRYSTLFYEGLKESGRVYADVKRLQELGRQDEARELVGEKRQELAMRKSLNQTQRQLSAINARMDMVRLSAWDGERKRRELDRLQVIKSRMTERAGKRIEEVRAWE
ncbi:LPD38 domain-containing protein [Stutzerimonas stutzeri]